MAPANSVHSLRWIRFFAERGHEIHWITLNQSRFAPLSGVEYHYALGRGPKLLYTILRISRLIDRITPDILHIHSAGTYGLVGSLAARRRPPSVVLSAWGSDVIFAAKHPIKRLFVRHALRMADVITVDAHHMVEAIGGLGVLLDKVHIINFGIETSHFRPLKRNDELRHRLGLGSDCLAVISLRSLEPIYDIETLICAVPVVRARIPRAQFVIAGTGSEEGALKALAEETGVAKHVTFVGMYEHDTLPQLLNCMDAYVSTSLSDAGIAASTAEAMACGVPVVVSDTGENRLWIEPGKNGFLVPASDPEALARTLVSLLSDRETAKRIGMLGRETIVERNDHATEMKKVETLYESLAMEQTQ